MPGYKPSNLPAISPNVANAELVLTCDGGEREHTVFPSFWREPEERGRVVKIINNALS